MKSIIRLFLIILALCVILYLIYIFFEYKREKDALQRYGDTVTKYSFYYNIDANLVLAVIKAESGFNEQAVSDKGAKGLMQILPSTGAYIAKLMNEDFSENSLFDSEINIKFGSYYLSNLIKKFKNTDTALAAYNAGEGNVAYWLTEYSDDGIKLNNIPFRETANYVEKVKKYYNYFRNSYNY